MKMRNSLTAGKAHDSLSNNSCPVWTQKCMIQFIDLMIHFFSSLSSSTIDMCHIFKQTANNGNYEL